MGMNAKEINEIPDPGARREAWLNWSPDPQTPEAAAFPARTFAPGFDIEADVHTPGAYAVGSEVVYEGELPCDEPAHTGSVIAVEDDASGDQVVTVKFDCGPGCTLADHIPALTQDILASELQSAE